MVEVNETKTSRAKRRSAGASDKAQRNATTKGEGKKQGYIEGMAPLRDKDIDRKGAELIDAMDQRKIWMEKAKAAREALIDMMVKKKLDEYLLDVDTRNFKLELTKATTVSAKKLKILPDES